jgi:hypothetical protein
VHACKWKVLVLVNEDEHGIWGRVIMWCITSFIYISIYVWFLMQKLMTIDNEFENGCTRYDCGLLNNWNIKSEHYFLFKFVMFPFSLSQNSMQAKSSNGKMQVERIMVNVINYWNNLMAPFLVTSRSPLNHKMVFQFYNRFFELM